MTARKHHSQHGADTRYHLIVRQDHRCFWCGVGFKRRPKSERPTLEHIIPMSKGGVDEIANLAVVHERCNR